MINLGEITHLADEAASTHNNLMNSQSEARSAEVEAIEALLSALKPAWSALASRTQIAYRSGNDPLRSWGDEGEEQADWRGVQLTSSEHGLSRRGGRDDTRGEMQGRDLYWLEDGTFIELVYSGSWSRWQGEGTAWESEVITHDSVTDLGEAGWLSPDTHDMAVEDLAARLSAQLKSVAEGKASKRAASNRARAERMKAWSVLLKGRGGQ